MSEPSEDFDSTMALLSSDVPEIKIPNYPRPTVDSDEEEVFFGPTMSEKEKFGKNSGLLLYFSFTIFLAQLNSYGTNRLCYK